MHQKTRSKSRRSSSARGSPVKRQRKDSSARSPSPQLPIPSNTCLTSVLAPGTCLVRGVTGRESCRRFFAYYGEERNLAAFAASKNFVATYASNGYQYTRVLKPIILLTMPYPVIYKFTGADQTMALYQYEAIAPLVRTLYPAHPEFDTPGHRADLSSSFFPFDASDYDELTSEEIAFIQTYQADNEYVSANPDYTTLEMVCHLGFSGWLRRASSAQRVSADEVAFCDIHQLYGGGYLIDTNDCNLQP